MGVMREVEPVTCAICNEPLAPSDAALYLVAESLLMHHACGHLLPCCRHMRRSREAPTIQANAEPRNVDHGTS